MKNKNYLVVDFGASNGRVSLVKFNGEKFSFEELNRFENRPVKASETLYWDILRLYYEMKIGIFKALVKYKEIISLGLDTWGTDFGIIGKNGKLIGNPIHYRDKSRNNLYSEFINNIITKKEIFFLTGVVLSSYYGIINMYLLKSTKAPELLNGYKYLMMPDIFNYFLTGNYLNEYTNSSTSAMFNQVEKKWEDKILNKLSISKDLFCSNVLPGTSIGTINDSVYEDMGIRKSKINVVVPATHDTSSAIAGIPLKKNIKNNLFIALGTWCIVLTVTKNPLINENVYNLGFSNVAGDKNKNILFKNVCGLWIIEQCMRKWVELKEVNISWSYIDKVYPKAPPFKAFIDVDDQIFLKYNNDMIRSILDYCISTKQYVPKEINEIARCFYESLTMKLKYTILKLESLINCKFESINIFGGGIKNKLLCQWIANLCNLPVNAGPAEATSVGNLLMQLAADREINNIEDGKEILINSTEILHFEPENTEIWFEAYKKYLNVLNQKMQ